jgi:hypothetical protein
MSSFATHNEPEECDAYTCEYMSIDVHRGYLSSAQCTELFETLMLYGAWPHAHTTKAGALMKKRNKIIYGDPVLPSYTIKYLGKTIKTRVRPWSQMPLLEKLAGWLSATTGQVYHVCVVQLYNNGEVGIDPHRDKEMAPGTIITSISLGATRKMAFERRGCGRLELELAAGDLCLLRPPTNDYWLHSIPKDASIKAPRMSLVFRNCDTMIPSHK